MTTDTNPLQERIEHELEAMFDGGGFNARDMARDLAPIIAAEVQAAKAEAWDEGCAASEQYYKRTAIGVPGSDPIPAPLNPHRETGDRA